MKNFLPILVAGFLGGVIALGGNAILVKDDIATYEINQSPASLVSGVPAEEINFVKSAAMATKAVVHIYAGESEELAQQRYQQERNQRRRNSPWGDFFGIGDDFFGRNFYRPKEGSGSGVIVSQDGYIVTNNHVVGFADNIKVTLSDGTVYKGIKIGTDPSTDLAVLKIEADDLPILKYGNSDQLMIGEWVLAVGNPFSYLTSTVTAGIVSAKGRNLDIIQGQKTIEEFIQTDAAINPGNSGGALVSPEGELIGINTAIATPTGVFAGYSFAIPSNLVREVVGDIIQRGGDIDRQISLGVAGYDVNDELVEEFNLKVDHGFYIDEVDRGGAANLSGILPGDVVIGINGDKVDNYDTIKDKMRLNKVGDFIVLEVNRKGKTQNIKIKLRKGL